jgi:hypothetical protein
MTIGVQPKITGLTLMLAAIAGLCAALLLCIWGLRFWDEPTLVNRAMRFRAAVSGFGGAGMEMATNGRTPCSAKVR